MWCAAYLLVVVYTFASFVHFEAWWDSALFFLSCFIASTHSWENLMCYWTVFIQISCIGNINSADYDWLMILFVCLFACWCLCIYDCVRVHCTILSAYTVVYIPFLKRVHTYLLQLVILISDVGISLFFFYFFFFCFLYSLDCKQIKRHTTEN